MYARFWKRLFDIILSLFGLIALSPLLLGLTAAGAAVMRGNPFFIQKRPGMINPETGEERIISLLKFRTMTDERDHEGNLLPDEKRLNRYGRFLRTFSLDGLISLVNILVGDISIVGPRPLLVKYLPLYSEEQRHRHDVRPGLTGYAQAHGRNAVQWEDRFAMDVWYTKHITLRNDIDILITTVKIVIKRDGIHSETSATMEEFKGSTEDSVITWEVPV